MIGLLDLRSCYFSQGREANEKGLEAAEVSVRRQLLGHERYTSRSARRQKSRSQVEKRKSPKNKKKTRKKEIYNHNHTDTQLISQIPSSDVRVPLTNQRAGRE